MSASRAQPDLLSRLERLHARGVQVRQCLLRLRAIGQRAQQIDRASPEAWNGIIGEKQEVIDQLGALGEPHSQDDADTIAMGANASDPRVKSAAARARQTTRSNAALLAEVVALEASLERRLVEQIRALADHMARPARVMQVRSAYGPQAGATPRFLDRRR